MFDYILTWRLALGSPVSYVSLQCMPMRLKDKKKKECPRCDTPQTRDHVLSACRRYSPISLASLFTQIDSIDILSYFFTSPPRSPLDLEPPPSYLGTQQKLVEKHTRCPPRPLRRARSGLRRRLHEGNRRPRLAEPPLPPKFRESTTCLQDDPLHRK